MPDFFFRDMEAGDIYAAHKAAEEFVREFPTATGWKSFCQYGVRYSSGFEPQFNVYRTKAGNIIVKKAV